MLFFANTNKEKNSMQNCVVSKLQCKRDIHQYQRENLLKSLSYCFRGQFISFLERLSTFLCFIRGLK